VARVGALDGRGTQPLYLGAGIAANDPVENPVFEPKWTRITGKGGWCICAVFFVCEGAGLMRRFCFRHKTSGVGAQLRC
jgi:hypothetical protein